MTAEQRKEVIRRHFALVDEGRLDESIATYWSKDVRVHGFGPEPLDAEGFRGLVQGFVQAFSEGRHTLEIMIAENDLVAAYWIWRAVHTGDLMGLPATGRSVRMHGVTIDRVENGRIVERWGSFDQMGLMGQLTAGAPMAEAVGEPR